MIISSASYKGGVGKSTVSQNLAVYFAHSGYKVCIVDCDESAATTKWAGVRQEKGIEPFIQIIQMTNPKTIIGTVNGLYKDHDVVIIDSPPSLFPIVSKIILLSHLIVIPVTPKGGSDIWVTQDFLERYEEVQQQKEERTPAFFLLNMFKDNYNLHKAFANALDEYGKDYGVGVLETRFNELVHFGEANQAGQGVFEYSKGKAKTEVAKLGKEIIQISEKI